MVINQLFCVRNCFERKTVLSMKEKWFWYVFKLDGSMCNDTI